MQTPSATADGAYGSPRVAAQAPVQGGDRGQGGAPPTGAAPGDIGDPHDKADRGPFDWFDDPVFWLIVVAAFGTGILGVRFYWSGGRVGADASVDIGDEWAALAGHLLFTMAGIVAFKTIASKAEIPGLQKFAAAI